MGQDPRRVHMHPLRSGTLPLQTARPLATSDTAYILPTRLDASEAGRLRAAFNKKGKHQILSVYNCPINCHKREQQHGHITHSEPSYAQRYFHNSLRDKEKKRQDTWAVQKH